MSASRGLKRAASTVPWRAHLEGISRMRSKLPPAPVDRFGAETIAELGREEDETALEEFRFHTLVGLMLSSQTQDHVTYAAVQRLRAMDGGLTPATVAATALGTLESLLKPVGFYRRKASYLQAMAQQVLKEGGHIPSTYDDLVKLKGVGPKMATLTMRIAFGEVVGISVDTHVHRISNTLKWCKTSSPEETEKALQELLPKEVWGTVNKLLVGFGQVRVCGVCTLC
jgi:endonuclease-3